ncbi:PDZ and LIM domain protein 3-like [Lineus longissimus]|uniref:PDZ and LIM domain protein 3-like n=1 Tax=Lineus longissimus TaxID=88925 RepID=UPI002B4D0888
MSTVTLTMQKHDPHQPWGFRMQGGTDFSAQLSIKKVLPNTPSDGYLTPGDAIVGINNQDASRMTHVQAQQLILNGGNVLHLTVRKGYVGGMDSFRHLQPKGNVKFSPYNASKLAKY